MKQSAKTGRRALGNEQVNETAAIYHIRNVCLSPYGGRFVGNQTSWQKRPLMNASMQKILLEDYVQKKYA